MCWTIHLTLLSVKLMQAVESLQELSNVSSENVYPNHMRPPGLKIPKNSLLSSASQTLSPCTPNQSNSSDNKRCVNCQCTSTPLWRKDKGSGLMYCNACGIYLKNHGKPRPLELIEGIGLSKIVNTPPGDSCSHAVVESMSHYCTVLACSLISQPCTGTNLFRKIYFAQ